MLRHSVYIVCEIEMRRRAFLLEGAALLVRKRVICGQNSILHLPLFRTALQGLLQQHFISCLGSESSDCIVTRLFHTVRQTIMCFFHRLSY